MAKIKLSELAKDFAIGNKVIIDILAKHNKAPKSASQALTEQEINIVLEELTQKNQVSNVSDIRALQIKAAEERNNAMKAKIMQKQEETTKTNDQRSEERRVGKEC